MPKQNRGGKRTTAQQYMVMPKGISQTQQNQNIPQVTPTPVVPPTPQQVAQGNVLPTGGVPFSQFEAMTDDQKADVILSALGVTTPFFLDDSPLQKLAYYTGLNDKPQMMDDKSLSALPGKDLWRSVHSAYNSRADIGYSGKEIYNQIATGDFTMYSDSGGSVHGKGIYFDVRKGSYGSGSGYTVIHAKMAPSARQISESAVNRMATNEMRSGSKLGQALRAVDRMDSASTAMVYGMAKGYDVVVANNGYHMFINRRGMAISNKTF